MLRVRVVDERGEGVAGIGVRIFPGRGGERAYPADAEGYASIPGDDIRSGELVFAKSDGGSIAWLDGVKLTLQNRRAEQVRGIPTPVMQLMPVDRRIQGSVVDGRGQPIGGVTIQAMRLHRPNNGSLNNFFSQPLDQLIAPATTGQDGKFSLRLPLMTGANLEAFHPRWIGPEIVIQQDQAGMTPDPIILEPTGQIVGQVVDDAGRPVAGAKVEARCAESFSGLGRQGAGVPDANRPRIHTRSGRAVTDTTGRFAIGRLTPSVYTLTLLELLGRPSVRAKAVEGIRVKPHTDATADLTVIEGRPLHGTVIDGESSRPIAGVELLCRRPATSPEADDIQIAKTDENGRFTFYVASGEHLVELRDTGKFSRLGRRILLVPEGGEPEPVRLVRLYRVVNAFRKSETQPAPHPTEILEPRPRVLTGKIRDSTGRPIAGVRISVIPNRENDQAYDTAVSDRDGEFVLARLPERAILVNLERPAFRNRRKGIGSNIAKVNWIYDLERDPRLDHQPEPAIDDPIPASVRDRLTFVDLVRRSTDLLADGPEGDGDDLNRLRRGIRKLGDTYFRIGEGMIRLDPQGTHALPREVDDIAVGARANRLHLLHATQQEAIPGSEVLSYMVHYGDGTSERIPIVCGRDILDWRMTPSHVELAADAKVAWTGLNDQTERKTHLDPFDASAIRLVSKTWMNPHPEKQITSIDMNLSAGITVDTFLVAATLERDE
jgi:hypothetical protein